MLPPGIRNGLNHVLIPMFILFFYGKEGPAATSVALRVGVPFSLTLYMVGGYVYIDHISLSLVYS